MAGYIVLWQVFFNWKSDGQWLEAMFSVKLYCVLCLFPLSRWDIQRIREQRILQRLQLRMYKKKGIQESEPEVTSFFPESDDGKWF